MKNHSKGGGNNDSSPDPKNDGGKKETYNRHVYVEPGVQIDLVKDFRKKYDANQQQSTALSKRQLFWTIISSVVLLLYTTVTGVQAYLFHVSNQNFKDSTRPWIGAVPIREVSPGYTGGWNWDLKYIPEDDAYKLSYIWSFKNSGKRPALIKRMINTAFTGVSCTDNPTFDPALDRPNQSVMLPDGTLQDVSVDGIPKKKWELIQQGKLEFCTYAYVEYIDISEPGRTVHHTTDCQHYLAPIGFAECRNRYAMAD